MDFAHSEPMNYEIADGLVDFGSTHVMSVDLFNTTLHTISDGAARPRQPEYNTIDLDRLQFGHVATDSMVSDVMNSGSVDLSNFDSSEKPGPPGGSEASEIDKMGVGLLEGGTTHAPTAASTSVYPVIIHSHSMQHDRINVDLLDHYCADATVANYDPTGLCSLNEDTRRADIRRVQQTRPSYQMQQTSTAGQFDGAINMVYPTQCIPTNFPHPTLPKRDNHEAISPKNDVSSENWRQEQPKCLDVSATTAKITADDWQEYRPFIEQLYLVENMKLRDVMQIMKTRFGFIASTKMYKTKITQWGLLKNYKAAEKEHLARTIKTYQESGKSIPPLIVRNRVAKLGRVRRFCKQRKILEEVCDALTAEQDSKATNLWTKAHLVHRAAAVATLASDVPNVRSSSLPSIHGSRKLSFDPERPFSTASKDGRIELILFQTKIYVQSKFDCTTGLNSSKHAVDLESLNIEKVTKDGGHDMKIWADNLIFGTAILMQHRSTQGWSMIHEACDMTHQIISQAHESFFRCLLGIISDRDMAMCPDLRTHLLRYFTKISAAILGCNHPVTVVLYHLQEQQILADVVRPSIEVLIDSFGKTLNRKNFEIWLLRDRYCYLLRDQGDYDAAESYGHHFVKQSEEIFGRIHWCTRNFLYRLGDTHFIRRMYRLAGCEFQDVLRRGREDLGNRFPDAVCIYALQGLARISEDVGDFAQSEEYWRLGLAGAVMIWGVEDGRTTYTVSLAEESFKNQGVDPEVWLQQNFGIGCV